MDTKVKKSENDIFAKIACIIVPTYITYFVIADGNITYVYYTFAIWIVYSFYQYFKKKKPFSLTDSLMALCLVYLFVGTIFSMSPAIAIKEFEITHPSWTRQKVANFELKNYFFSSSRGGHPITDVKYTYHFNKQTYGSTLDNGITYDDFYLQFKDVDELKAISKESTDKALKTNDYVLFVNAKEPKESRLFLLKTWITFKYSTIFRMLANTVILISIVLICLLIFASIYFRENVFGLLRRYRPF
ncbi:hypothetical protein [Soonwooa sp.]|uniref:hypothetical protein n=1 Tax=Soonwooa sp. TaxID=1938592 RepID=UPI00261F61AC|nr:hypothetical protein [Soonwooa sp.]